VPRTLCRIYDPIREKMYRELGLETISPTIMGANVLYDLLREPAPVKDEA
jgi:trk system potassium uptake protein TrkA